MGRLYVYPRVSSILFPELGQSFCHGSSGLVSAFPLHTRDFSHAERPLPRLSYATRPGGAVSLSRNNIASQVTPSSPRPRYRLPVHGTRRQPEGKRSAGAGVAGADPTATCYIDSQNGGSERLRPRLLPDAEN